jgi:aminopeptidase N
VPALLTYWYSGPITPCTPQTTEDLIFLLANDSDEFNRWEAGQRITKELLMKLYDVRMAGGELKMDAAVVEAFRAVLTDTTLDKSFVAAAMSVPSEGEMVEALTTADPDAVHAVRDFVTTSLAEVCSAGTCPQ